jgi:hypothetical protein
MFHNVWVYSFVWHVVSLGMSMDCFQVFQNTNVLDYCYICEIFVRSEKSQTNQIDFVMT